MRYIVCGFARSGTTAMVKALHAGGIPAFWQPTENDQYNEGGSWEVAGEYWQQKGFPYIPETEGKVFKIMSGSFERITGDEPTTVFLMYRNPERIVESIKRAFQQEVPGDRVYELWLRQMRGVREHLVTKGIPFFTVHFNRLIKLPHRVFAELAEHVPIDAKKAASVINRKLSVEHSYELSAN